MTGRNPFLEGKTDEEFQQQLLMLSTAPWNPAAHETLRLALELELLLGDGEHLPAPLAAYRAWWQEHLTSETPLPWQLAGASLLGRRPPACATLHLTPPSGPVSWTSVSQFLREPARLAYLRMGFGLSPALLLSVLDTLARERPERGVRAIPRRRWDLHTILAAWGGDEIPDLHLIIRAGVQPAAAMSQEGRAVLLLPEEEGDDPLAAAAAAHECAHLRHLWHARKQGRSLAEISIWEREEAAVRAEATFVVEAMGVPTVGFWLQQRLAGCLRGLAEDFAPESDGAVYRRPPLLHCVQICAHMVTQPHLLPRR